MLAQGVPAVYADSVKGQNPATPSQKMDICMKSLDHLATAACLAVVGFLGACSSTPLPPAAATATAPVAVAANPAAPAPVAAKSAEPAAVTRSALPPYLDPANALSTQRSVYFDFDQSVVKPEGQRLLELHGKYLAAHPKVAIKVEGNTDEQGGAEYNLALGQKRAQAVAQVLKAYGVTDAQMEAISFGKEKPQATGHDEAAHARNRRADLDYPKQ
jgi:peptidoglycan-associated lipoprotein